MDKQIQKLKNLVDKHLHQTKEEIYKKWGKSLQDSDNEIWFFRKYRGFIFWDEIAFIFQEDKVVDISISQYLLGFEYSTIFYYENATPEYKIMKNY